MIESKFGEFLRSPLGVLLIVGLILVGGVLVFLYVRSVFKGLIEYTPFPY